jgi:ComF family protein
LQVDMCAFSTHPLLEQRCRLCHAPLHGAQALCDRCHQALPHLVHACPGCALPLDARTPPGSRCGECLADPPPFDRARVPFRYREPLNDLVGHFKYHRGLSDGRLLGELLARHIAHDHAAVDLLLPVPLHPARLRERGFNQAAELARVVSRVCGIPWRSDLLVRDKPGASQREADRKTRLRNVRAAFRCRSKPLPARVALIDDVITTGATVRAAAARLKQAGIDWVEIWAVARTPRPGDD